MLISARASYLTKILIMQERLIVKNMSKIFIAITTMFTFMIYGFVWGIIFLIAKKEDEGID